MEVHYAIYHQSIDSTHAVLRRDLERKNLIKKWPRLSTLRGLSDDKFFKRFVAHHLNEVRVGDVLPKATSEDTWYFIAQPESEILGKFELVGA